MKKLLPFALAALFTKLTSACAHEDIFRQRFYIKLQSGTSINSGNIDSLPKSSTPSSLSRKNDLQYSLEIGKLYTKYLGLGVSTHSILESDLEGKAITPNTDEIYLNSKINSHAALLNVYFYPLQNSNKFAPYIIAGLGGSLNKIDTTYYVTDVNSVGNNTNSFLFGNTNYSLAWQLGAGISYKLRSDLNIELNYKYLNHGKVGTKFSSIVQPGTSDTTALDLEDTSPKFSIKNLVSQQISVGITFFM